MKLTTEENLLDNLVGRLSVELAKWWGSKNLAIVRKAASYLARRDSEYSKLEDVLLLNNLIYSTAELGDPKTAVAILERNGEYMSAATTAEQYGLMEDAKRIYEKVREQYQQMLSGGIGDKGAQLAVLSITIRSLGRVEKELGNINRANELFEELVKKNLDSGWIDYWKDAADIVAREIGDRERALGIYQQIVKAIPDEKSSLRRDAQYEIGKIQKEMSGHKLSG